MSAITSDTFSGKSSRISPRSSNRSSSDTPESISCWTSFRKEAGGGLGFGSLYEQSSTLNVHSGAPIMKIVGPWVSPWCRTGDPSAPHLARSVWPLTRASVCSRIGRFRQSRRPISGRAPLGHGLRRPRLERLLSPGDVPPRTHSFSPPRAHSRLVPPGAAHGAP